MTPRYAVSLPLPPDLATTCRMAARAEAMGYESGWIADTGAGPDAFVVAAAVAGVTRKLRLGTAVVPVYTRTPSVMAAQTASVAQLAPGRFVLGIGASSEAIVERWGGVPFQKPLTRMRETVGVLRQMLAGERVNFEGKTIRSQGFRLAARAPQPVPIYVAALMPAMLELAGELADGVILNFMPVDAVPRMMEHVRRGAERAGRDPSTIEVVSRFMVAVADDPTPIRNAMKMMMGPYFATSVYNRFVAWCGFAEEAGAILDAWNTKDRTRNVASVTDEMVERLVILGPRDYCRARIQAFVDAGVTTPMINPVVPGEDAMTAVLEAMAP
jgi:probable F420-dependent oxidoreductase